MLKLATPVALIVTLSLLSTVVLGDNLSFLRKNKGPIATYSDHDFETFKKTLWTTLNDNADGAANSWENTETGASGSFKPLRTFNDNGLVCRRLLIDNKANDLSARYVFNFCKQSDDSWKIVVK